MQAYTQTEHAQLTLHDGVVLGHPRGDDRLLAEAVNLRQRPDSFLDLMSEKKKSCVFSGDESFKKYPRP